MTDLGFALLRVVVQSGPRPLFATISGAHLYDFPSPDSDVDRQPCDNFVVRASLELAPYA